MVSSPELSWMTSPRPDQPVLPDPVTLPAAAPVCASRAGPRAGLPHHLFLERTPAEMPAFPLAQKGDAGFAPAQRAGRRRLPADLGRNGSAAG